jgi:hypothetical protein
MTMGWELKHSVVAQADRQTVWQFYSNLDNMARLEGDAVESISLDGPFRTGARGTTRMKGQPPTYWRLAEVRPPERSVTEIELNEAVLRFTWTFDELPDGRTRLSQHLVLEGPGAAAYAPVMEEHFTGNVAKGMERLVQEIEKAAATGTSGQPARNRGSTA